MNLTTQHLEHPSPTFLRQRAATEARLGVGARIVKFFMDAPPPDAPSRQEIDALLAENSRLRAEVQIARLELAKLFGDDDEDEDW